MLIAVKHVHSAVKRGEVIISPLPAARSTSLSGEVEKEGGI